MFGIEVKIDNRFRNVQSAVEDAKFRNLRHAGFGISANAKASIRTSEEASLPGLPPSTRGRGRNNLRAAIFVDSTGDDVIVGPRHSYVGDSGEVHEFGGERFGESFDERAFMGPALKQNVVRFADDWEGSVGQ